MERADSRDNKNGLNDLHARPDIVRVLKSRRLRWAEHLVRIGKKVRNEFLFGS